MSYYSNPYNQPRPEQKPNGQPQRRPVMPFANVRPLQRNESEKPKLIRAKHGYHGIVRKPTRFLVGEAGAEHVRITPIKRKRNVMIDFDYKSSITDFDFSGGML